jgi:uncharacterized protein (TIGR03083 family)
MNPTTRDTDFVGHLRRESRRFVEALTGVDASAAVPSCPGWTAADLAWHLAEVQLFWAAVVRDGSTDGAVAESAEAARPPRPDAYADVLALVRSATADLVAVLREGADDAPAWTWSADRTVGFVRRRQAHEALVHRVDAELTAGSVSEMDALLAADGVDEVVTVMWSGLPEWATFVPNGGTVELAAVDVGRTWRVQPGRFTGTSPTSGTTYDEPTAEVVTGLSEPAVAHVGAAAADLDRWVWNRGGAVETSGDPHALERLAAVVRAGIQ